MLIDDEEVERLITRIAAATFVCLVDDTLITFEYPSNHLKQVADVYYEQEYEKAINTGLLSRTALEKLIEERKLFTEIEQKKLDSLNSKLKAQRMLLAKTTLVKANQERIKNVIIGLKEEIYGLSYKKSSKLSMSAEVRANEERTLYLCWSSTYKEDKLLWDSFNTFKNSIELKFRDKVISKFLTFYSGITTEAIRCIARHNMWRIRYVNSQKTGEALFGVASLDYTTDMLNLAYWSNYYDNIYQMMPEDRPSDLIIEDDEALDAYMKAYYEERNREDAARRSKNKNPGKLSAFDSEEVIVTASNELWHDIEYDKPREAQKIKDRVSIKKRTKRG